MRRARVIEVETSCELRGALQTIKEALEGYDPEGAIYIYSLEEFGSDVVFASDALLSASAIRARILEGDYVEP